MNSNEIKNAIIEPAQDALSCEYLVIGSGAGGAFTASVLSKKGGQVLVIEEGPYVMPEHTHTSITGSFMSVWRNGGAMPTVGNGNLVYAEGRCVGGTTMINAGLITPPEEKAIEEWGERFEMEDISYGTVLQYHKQVEQILNAHILNDVENKSGQYFKHGAEKLGIKGQNVKVAAQQNEQGKLVKNNMQKTCLKTAVQSGAKIIPNCRAVRLKIGHGKVKEVDCVYTDHREKQKKITIKCRAVWICAGASQTPLLLRRSGITKNIGNNLRFHPMQKMIAEFRDPIDAYKDIMPSYQIKDPEGKITIGASLSLPPFIATGLLEQWPNIFTDKIRHMAIYYVALHSSARGQIRNTPVLNGYTVKYNLNQGDRQCLRDGMEKLTKILRASGAVNIHKPKNDNLTAVHAFSSCPMGENKKICALDSYGKVHGYNNIYVNDASMLPTSPGGNPQGPIMTMTLRNLENTQP